MNQQVAVSGSDFKKNLVMVIAGVIIVTGCILTPVLIVENVKDNIQGPRTALIIVDIQNDFCVGGSLEVPKSLEVIQKINEIRENHGDIFDVVILSQDYHPKNHVSFASNHPGAQPFTTIKLLNGIQQELWPDHCVQGTFGAQLHTNLIVKSTDKVIQKATLSGSDSYSVFGSYGEKTGVQEYLDLSIIERVYVCGLAYDYCVGNTAIDSAKNGFNTFVIKNASGSISPQSVEAMENKFKEFSNLTIINDDQL